MINKIPKNFMINGNFSSQKPNKRKGLKVNGKKVILKVNFLVFLKRWKKDTKKKKWHTFIQDDLIKYRNNGLIKIKILLTCRQKDTTRSKESPVSSFLPEIFTRPKQGKYAKITPRKNLNKFLKKSNCMLEAELFDN